jgi:methylmalonyl-CoA mutase cobalamin-binding subunit
MISIGKLSRSTGFSAERLRIWELRYGAPKGRRLPSGHRRYAPEEVERLHLVREALDRGFRPRHVVASSREELMKLLEQLGTSLAGGLPEPGRLPWTPLSWVQASARMDEAALERQFMEHWLALGSLRFLRERAVPFVVSLGEEWHAKRLSAAEEHFGSEKLGDFLAGIWRRLNELNRGPAALLTTLPGDPHRIGLQMVALVSAMAGWRVLYLGPSTPLEEVATTAAKVGVKAVLISVSLSVDPSQARSQTLALRGSLPRGVELVVGGAHAPTPADGAWTRFGDLQPFFSWARSRTVPVPAP